MTPDPAAATGLRLIAGTAWPGQHPDHCTYSKNPPDCPSRALYHVDEWGGPQGADLCQEHLDHLQATGALTQPAYRYTAEEMEENARECAIEYAAIHRMAVDTAPPSTRANLRRVK